MDEGEKISLGNSGNYHDNDEDIVSDEKERRPMITFQPKQQNSLLKKQIIDSFYYLIITKTFYSIFYYDFIYICPNNIKPF